MPPSSSMATSITKLSNTPKSLKLVPVDLRGSILQTQNYQDVARDSAYVRLRGNLCRQTAAKPILIVLHGVTNVHALQAGLRWATKSTPETICQYVISTGRDMVQIKYLYQLLRLFYIAQKLVMKKLQRQILGVWAIARPRFQWVPLFTELPTRGTFPRDVPSSKRMPTYGILGMYLQSRAEILKQKHIAEGWAIEPILSLNDTLNLLETDPQIQLTRVKIKHKSDVEEVAKLWQIDLVDDLPHQFSVSPNNSEGCFGPTRNVLQHEIDIENSSETEY